MGELGADADRGDRRRLCHTRRNRCASFQSGSVEKPSNSPRHFRFSSGKPEDWSKVKYAFFTGPRSFVVEREGIKLKFRFTGVGWLINDLDLGLAEVKH